MFEYAVLLLLLEELGDEEDEVEWQDDNAFLGRAVIRRGALMIPRKSAFMHLYRSMQDDALITLCGLDHRAFHLLLGLFCPMFDVYTPYPQSHTNPGHMRRLSGKPGGRPRMINAVMGLGLVLVWTRTRGSLKVLQLIFGLTANPLSVWLRFGRRILVKVLAGHPDARVELPSPQEVTRFKQLIRNKYPNLVNIWAAMDGLKLLVATNEAVQNMFYNGWTHDHYVSNLFVFSPDGLIRACLLNAPGSWHDSTLASVSSIYDKLDEINDRERTHGGAQVVVDSAFGRESRPSLLKSHQTNFDQDGNVRMNQNIHHAATSVRQLSEWGMRGLQASFPRLKDRLPYEEVGEWRIILRMIVLLYNFRASTVGFNQIQTVYMPELCQNALQAMNNY